MDCARAPHRREGRDRARRCAGRARVLRRRQAWSSTATPRRRSSPRRSAAPATARGRRRARRRGTPFWRRMHARSRRRRRSPCCSWPSSRRCSGASRAVAEPLYLLSMVVGRLADRLGRVRGAAPSLAGHERADDARGARRRRDRRVRRGRLGAGPVRRRHRPRGACPRAQPALRRGADGACARPGARAATTAASDSSTSSRTSRRRSDSSCARGAHCRWTALVSRGRLERRPGTDYRRVGARRQGARRRGLRRHVERARRPDACRTTRRAEDSTLSRVAALVEEAQGSRAPAERFIDRFARIYTPLVFARRAAARDGSARFGGDVRHLDATAPLALLIVACPCSLVISVPVAVVSAVGGAARRGILIKGGQALEDLGGRPRRRDRQDRNPHARAAAARVDRRRSTASASRRRSALVAGRREQHSEHPLGAALAREPARERSLDVPRGLRLRRRSPAAAPRPRSPAAGSGRAGRG